MRQLFRSLSGICVVGILAVACATAQDKRGESPLLPKGTRITFESRGKRLGDVLRAVSKQGPVPVLDQRSKRDNPVVRCSVKGKTFWEAVDYIAAELGARVYPFAADRVLLVDSPGVKMPAVEVEAFRVSLQRVACYRDFDSGLGRSRITLGVVWEPKAAPLLLGLARFDIRYDGSKRTGGSGTGRIPVVGRKSTAVTVDFERLPRRITKIDRLTGTIRAIGPNRMAHLVFDGQELSTARNGLTRNPAKDTSVTIKSVKSLSKKLWQITVELRYPSPGPALESFETHLWVAHNRLWLESKRGRRTKVAARPGSEFPLELRPDYALIEYTVGDDKNGPDLGSLGGWRVHYRAPERIISYDIPFRFVDIPLP